MRTRVIAWGADEAPDIDRVYDEGISAAESARIMQTYPAVSFSLMEWISASAVDAALAAQGATEEPQPMCTFAGIPFYADDLEGS